MAKEIKFNIKLRYQPLTPPSLRNLLTINAKREVSSTSLFA